MSVKVVIREFRDQNEIADLPTNHLLAENKLLSVPEATTVLELDQAISNMRAKPIRWQGYVHFELIDGDKISYTRDLNTARNFLPPA